MDSVLRAAAIYGFLLIVFRIAGKRTLAQMTPFDLVLLLVIGEATQQALLGEDFSITNAFVVITSLIAIDIGLSLLKGRSKMLAKVTEGMPMIIVDDGKPLKERMDRARVDDDDVLSSAREKHGIARMEEIKYAILERDGQISVIPKKS